MIRFGISMACVSLAVLALAGCNKPGGTAAGDGDGGGLVPPAEAPVAAPVVTDIKSVSPMSQKPGLWQITQTLPNMPNAAIASKICVDAGMGEKMATYGMNNKTGSDTDCVNKTVTSTPTGADIAMTCTSKERTTDMKMHVERISDVEFKQTMDAKFSPAMAGGKDTMSMSMTGKWLGECPSGMKGGDVQIDKAGVTANMYEAMAKMKKEAAN